MSTSKPLIFTVIAFLAAWLVFLALSPGHVNNVDGYVVYHANEQYLRTGQLTIDEVRGHEYTGRVPYVRFDEEGNRYHVYGHVFFWMTLPFTALGLWLAPMVGLDACQLSQFTFSLANTLYSALAVAVWSAVAFRLGASRRSVVALVALLVFASPILFYATSTWREPGTMLLLSLAVLAFLGHVDHPGSWFRGTLFGVALGALFLFKEANGLISACLWTAMAGYAWRRKGAAPIGVALATGLPVAVALVAHGLIMATRFGTPFTTCYDPSRGLLAGDPLHRLGAILFSPDLGLVFYAAPVVLGCIGLSSVHRRAPALSTGLIAASLLSLALHSIVVSGEGGRFVWGPRHLIPLFPFFLLALVLSLEGCGSLWRWVTRGVVVMSVFVQILPAVVPYHLYPEIRERSPPSVAQNLPSRIPGTVLLAVHRLVGVGDCIVGGHFGVDPGLQWDLSADDATRGRPNVWWLRRDGPRSAPPIGGLLFLAAAVCWWKLLRLGRRPEELPAKPEPGDPGA